MRSFLPIYVVICIIGTGIIGCAPVASHSEQGKEAANMAPAPTEKPLVQLFIHNYSRPHFSDVVEKVSKDSGLFRDFKLDPDTADHADFRIELALTRELDKLSLGEQVWQAETKSVFPFLLPPFWFSPSPCARYKYYLSAEIFDHNGTKLTSYDAEDSETALSWVHPPDCGQVETAGMMHAVAERMLTKFYGEIANTGVLRPGFLKPQEEELSEKKPLVFFSTEYPFDQEMIKQLASTTPNFPRYTLDKSKAEDTDFSVAIHISTKAGEVSISRAPLVIFTLGLVSGCGPAELSLTASVRGKNGNEIRSYALFGTAATNMDCELSWENEKKTRTDLLKTLLQQIVRDGILPRPSGVSDQ
jgi:hypothetical protein